MYALMSQRDVLSSFKKETCSNVSILSKIYPMSSDLSRQIFKEDALEKPTQSIFMHLSYYLVSIVDPQRASALPWPLYDTAAEKKYRTEFSTFVLEYAKQGLLNPVMSSYFVNPACFKVTKLMYQLSQLAVQRSLKAKMRDQQVILYDDVTEKFKSKYKDFLENIDKETKAMMNKFNVYKQKKKTIEEIAEMMRKKIVENEEKLRQIEKQGLLKNIIANFVKQNKFKTELVTEINKIGDVNQTVPYFNDWLQQTDKEIDLLESRWNDSAGSFIKLAHKCRNTTENLIQKHTGEMDKKAYLVEYNPKTDSFDTKDLEAQVNSQQKFILKNIVKEQTLNFPNLVRGFVISICFILKNADLSDDIFKFNEYLEAEKRNYGEVSAALRILLDRLMSAEEKLEPQPMKLFHNTTSEYPEIPPLPDLSDIIITPEPINMPFEPFTPLNISKHQFNLRKKNAPMFVKPQPKSLITPFHQGPRDDFLKTLISCRVSAYDRPNTSHNISTITQAANRINETIAECSSGFTKQQIQRLLSTKKASTKKAKLPERFNVNIVKGGLFNESKDSSLVRSHSSPNLFESKERRSRLKDRFLSVMQDDIPALLEVSGISVIENNSEYANEHEIISLDSTKEVTSKIPTIVLSSDSITQKDANDRSGSVTSMLGNTQQSKIFESSKEDTLNTPKTNNPVKRTSSIEKIISRFKKVRANVVADKSDISKDIDTIHEEKENNLNAVNIDVFSANKMLLPDLLSPNYSVVKKPTDFLDELCFEIEEKEYRKPRQSLGTALGVDQSVLDQFDLID